MNDFADLMLWLMLAFLALIFAITLGDQTAENARAMDNCVILHNGVEVRSIDTDWYCRTPDSIWINMGVVES